MWNRRLELQHAAIARRQRISNQRLASRQLRFSARSGSGKCNGRPRRRPVRLSTCRRGDLNPHEISLTSPSSWRVCLFRHFDVDERTTVAGNRCQGYWRTSRKLSASTLKNQTTENIVVIRVRFRSAAVDPRAVVPAPPNMSERPPPRPLCNRTPATIPAVEPRLIATTTYITMLRTVRKLSGSAGCARRHGFGSAADLVVTVTPVTTSAKWQATGWP